VAGVRVPIACTLSVDDAATRLDEWRAMLTRVVASVERVAPTELELRLQTAPGDLDRLVDLVQREATCCTFFEFALHVAADAVTLRVTVPADAAPVLDGFAALAGPPSA
jgi:hypothetical protein